MIQDLIACVIVFNVLLTALGLADLVLSSVKFVANAFSVWLTVSNIRIVQTGLTKDLHMYK